MSTYSSGMLQPRFLGRADFVRKICYLGTLNRNQALVSCNNVC